MGWFIKLKEWLESLDNLDKFVFAISGFLLLIALFSVIYYFFIFSGGISSEQTDWGLFGDYVGGFIGSMISLVAVLLIFITYRLQQKELKATTKALEAQNTQLEIQQFQSVLFKLLERKDFILNRFTCPLLKIEQDYRRRREKYKRESDQHGDIQKRCLKENWKNYKNDLLPYFNVISSTTTYLHNFYPENPIEVKAKEQAFRIFSSNLTSREKIVLNRILQYHEFFDPDNNEVNAFREYALEYRVLN